MGAVFGERAVSGLAGECAGLGQRTKSLADVIEQVCDKGNVQRVKATANG
jgi:hypothetical protein